VKDRRGGAGKARVAEPPRQRTGRDRREEARAAAREAVRTVNRADGRELEVSVKASPRIRTLAELLTEAKVDLELWEVRDQVVNSWEAANGEGTITPLFQVKAWLRRRPDAGVQKAFEQRILEQVRALGREFGGAPAVQVKRAALPPGERVLLEVAVVDHHLGKYAVAEESGAGGTIEEQERHWVEATEHFLRVAQAGGPLARILLPFGNDLLHFDNRAQQTTGGTPMDSVQGRYFEIVLRAQRLLAWQIARCRQVATVDVLAIPGNHDTHSTFHIGQYLQAQFHADQGVRFDVSANPRKYYRWGRTLLGFTHGKDEKIQQLPLLMANEAAAAWAACPDREWHLGHLHKKDKTVFAAGDSFGGVRVSRLPSLSAHDAWHHGQGHRDRRASEAYRWNAATGYAGHDSFNVPESHAARVTIGDATAAPKAGRIIRPRELAASR
jgi:hypothetical protein